MKITIQDILAEWSYKAPNEMDEARRIGMLICERLNETRWLTWTKFPNKFANCKTDCEIHKLISDFSGWLVEVGINKERKKKKEEDHGDCE